MDRMVPLEKEKLLREERGLAIKSSFGDIHTAYKLIYMHEFIHTHTYLRRYVHAYIRDLDTFRPTCIYAYTQMNKNIQLQIRLK